jgi:hypothetical protein
LKINKGFYFSNIFGKLGEVKKGLLIILFLIAGIAIYSCKKKKEPEKVDVGEAYYPPTIGKFIVYDVDSIIYDEFTYDSTHYKYQIKEKIEEQFTDIQGKPAYKLARYIKKFNAAVSYTAMAWTIKDVWQVNITGSDVEVVEENTRFVKMVFPVKESKTWDGNATNTIGQWDYKYLFVDKPETVNSHSFDKVLLVEEKNFRTLISDEYYAEKYAKDLGLVYREIIDLDFDEVVPMNAIIDTVAKKKGVIYKSIMTAYGYE